MDSLHLTKRGDGVAVIEFDSPGSSVNILSRAFFGEFAACLDDVLKDPATIGAVLASRKADNFIAGANVQEFLAMKDASEGESFSREGHALLNRMAEAQKPFVAAIHGAALGGGLEVALACHYRLATDHPKTALGLPEVMLGLLPGGGGTQRLPRLIGLPRALPMLLTGKRLYARQALKAGLVDALTSPGGLVETACLAVRRLAEGKLGAKDGVPWLERLAARSPFRGVVLSKARDEVRKRTRGLYPAPPLVLECVEEGLVNGQAAGEERESVLFGKLTVSPEAKNLIRLFDMTTGMKKLAESAAPRPVKRLAVLGAGLMGEGIATVSLPLQPVVLKDVADRMLAKAAKNIRSALQKKVKSGALARVDGDRQWFSLHLATDTEALRSADLVIEAVFEDLELKRNVREETERVLRDDAVFASNTSALPIARIAEGARHPERVLGMHYFSPVPAMPLLEVVVAKDTAEWAVATAKAYGVAQGKTVIVVKDGPGFYTTRILAPFLNEAILLLDEGADIPALDAALKDFGFPIGPIALLDEVGIDVGAHVASDLGKVFEERGLGSSPSLPKLFAAGFAGKKNRRGFYLYPEGEKKRGGREVNPEVYAFFGGTPRKSVPPRDTADRMSLVMVNEAVHCLEEGVIASPRDGDAGAVLGLGFPPFRGGPFRYVDTIGAWAIVKRLEALEKQCGKRFAPAPMLKQLAADGKTFT